MLFYPVTNFYYRQVKSVVENHYERWSLAQRWVEVCMILLCATRLLNIIAVSQWASAQIEYDPIAYFVFRNVKQYDGYFLFCGVLFCFDSLAVKRTLHFGRKDTIAVLAYYDLVVNGTEIYRKYLKTHDCIEQIRKQKTSEIEEKLVNWIPLSKLIPWMNHLAAVLANVSMLINLDCVDKKKMCKHRLTLFPTMSSALRNKLMVRLILFNKLFAVVFWIVAIHIVAIIGFFAPTIMAPFPPVGCIPVLLDFSLAIVFLYFYFRDLMTTVHYVVITTMVYNTHIEEGNRMLKQMIRLSKAKKCDCYSRPLIQYFIGEHSKMSEMVLQVDREFVSTLVFIIMVIQIPINIIMAHRVVFHPMSSIELLCTCGVILAQVLNLSVALLPMARTSAHLHRTEQYLPVIQTQLYSRLTTETHFKWQLDCTYSRLMCGSVKLGFSISPGKTLTYTALYEVLLIYLAYLLTIFSFLMSR